MGRAPRGEGPGRAGPPTGQRDGQVRGAAGPGGTRRGRAGCRPGGGKDEEEEEKEKKKKKEKKGASRSAGAAASLAAGPRPGPAAAGRSAVRAGRASVCGRARAGDAGGGLPLF